MSKNYSTNARIGNSTNRRRSEHIEQREFVAWFRQTFDGVRIFAIPNGEQRSRTAGARLKAEGVSAGVPDLFIPAWGQFIEMKRADGGKTSKVQKDWINYLEDVGYHADVCHGIEEAKEICKRHFTARVNAGLIKP